MLRNILLVFFSLVSIITIANIFFSVVNIFSASGKDYLSKDYVPKEWNILITLLIFQIFLGLVLYFVYTNHNDLMNELLNQAIAFVKLNKKWFIFSGVASFIGFISMGAPGFAFLVSFDFVTESLNSVFPLSLKSFRDKYHGDNMWPAAILISLIWPWLVFLFNKIYTSYMVSSSGPLSITLSFLTMFLLLFNCC